MMVRELRVRSALSKSGLRELDYSLNPYYGCSYSCVYCYAPNFTPNLEISSRWGEAVAVKVNLIEVLKEEVRRLRRGTVGVSTITDPYQPVEAIYGLTRSSLEVLLKENFKVSVQTKSPLILRDLDLLSKFREKVDVGFTITTLDPNVSELLEPKAPPPVGRLKAIRKVKERGIESWIFLGPIVPNYNDEGIEEVISKASELGSRVIYDRFNQYPSLKIKAPVSRVWWREKEREILRTCDRWSVECHSEQEDWILERRKRGVLTLEDFKE